jgi:hypothetical protein
MAFAGDGIDRCQPDHFSPEEQRVEIAGGNIPLLPKGSQNK